jgi:SagB-type dehydrogenase family enzyme
VQDGDRRDDLSTAALGQEWVRRAAAVVVIAAVAKRTTRKYRERGIRYVHIEVGHAAQNICLQAAAMDLGTVMVGAFKDDEVKRVLDLPSDESPLAIVSIGRPK